MRIELGNDFRENYRMAMYFTEFLLRTFQNIRKKIQDGGPSEADLMKTTSVKVLILRDCPLFFENIKEI